VANAASNNISVIAIDSGSGALTAVANSPFSVGLPILNMQLSPSGNLLYVSAASQPLGLIEGFNVSGGVLQSIGVTPTDGINPTGMAIDPSETHLYAANTSSNSISIFTIDSAGGLAEVTGSPINDQYLNPISLLFDAAGGFLYVANQGSNNVAAYSIDASTGLPAILTTSTTTGAFSTESSPGILALDPGGKYLYVGNQGAAAGIQVFGISSGNLTTLSTYTVGGTPTSIAVLGK
jgi:6-phosphogluconolactonase